MTRRPCSVVLVVTLLTRCTSASQPPMRSTPTLPHPAMTSLPATVTPRPSATATALPALTPLPPITLSFHHLRIEYSTTSPWTRLTLETMEGFLTSRLISLDGDRGTAEISTSRTGHVLLQLNRVEQDMWLEQPQSIGMTVDIALDPRSIDRPLLFQQEKGAWFESTVRIYVLDQGSPRLIREARQTDELGRFSVDLSELQPTHVEFERLAPPRMLWAIYYPWTAWDQAVDCTDHPLLTYEYNPDGTLTPETFGQQIRETQIREAKSAGIDGFLVSWFDDPISRSNLSLQLEAAEALDFRIAIYLEPLLDNALNPDIERWIADAIDQFGSHPAYMQVDNKPVIVVFSSQVATRDTWREMFADLAFHGHEASYIAMSYDLADLEVFDGLHQYAALYDVSQLPDLASTYATLAQSVRNYPLLEESPRQRIFAATVQPGFDACPYDPEVNFIVERQEGAYYQSTFDAAVRSDPDWIIITTWNEFGENTHIEPSERYGDLYLRLTREFAQRWRRISPADD